MEQKTRELVVEHYGKADLNPKVRDAIQRAFGSAKLSAADLNALDQFHVGGLKATSDLLKALEIKKGQMVLDVGCGLGGPARHAAQEFGAQVVGIDLNASFVDLAKMLSEGSPLENQVSFQQADATHLPFSDETFDRVYTQHVAMNIENRARLYAGVYSTLKPGGLFGFFDVLSGGKGPLTYPVPWASRAEISFLLDESATRDVLKEQGFGTVSWIDKTAEGITGLQKQIEIQKQGGTNALNLTLVMGPQFGPMAANLLQNFVEGKARLVQGVFKRLII